MAHLLAATSYTRTADKLPGGVLTRNLLLALGVLSLALVLAVLLRRFVKQIFFALKDERRLRWAQTVDEALRRGELPQQVPSLWFGGKWAAEEALLQRLGTATLPERHVLQSLFRTWGLLGIRRLRLRRSDKWEQARSALVLGRMRCAEALPDLLCLLQHASEGPLVAAVNALELLGEPTAIEALVGLLVRRGTRLTRPILSALIRCGRDAPQLLLPHLGHRLPLVRMTVAAALAEVASKREVPCLIQAASDPEPDVRSKIARALGRTGDAAVPEVLQRLATDPVWYVRLRAVDALAQIRLPVVHDRIMQAMRDPDWRVREKAAVALYECLGEPASLLRRIREELGDRYALEALVATLERQGVTWHAINSLCSPIAATRKESEALIIELLRDRKFTAALYAIEAHPDQAVRREVLRLVNDEAGPSVRGPLKSLLESRTLDLETRRGVEMFLTRYGK